MDLQSHTHNYRHIWKTLDASRELIKIHSDINVDNVFISAAKCEQTASKISLVILDSIEQKKRYTKELEEALALSKECNTNLTKLLGTIRKG